MNYRKLSIAGALVAIIAFQSIAVPYRHQRFHYLEERALQDRDSSGTATGDEDDDYFKGWSRDSLLHYADSILTMETSDTLEDEPIVVEDSSSLQHKIDSIYRARFVADSTLKAEIAFKAWFDSLSKYDKKVWLMENVIIPAKLAKMDSITHVKDSIKAYKDSVREAKPRILESPFVPDSLRYKRILTFRHDQRFGDISFYTRDTSYNFHYYDYPFMKEDVNATWLGDAGSPVQYHNIFKRTETKEENAVFFEPYSSWTDNPSSLTEYNSKTPHTELGYWGTLLSGESKEELNLRFMTTQNITPAFNLTFELNKFGTKGALDNAKTDNYCLSAHGNYLGKRYVAHFGYIRSHITRKENGGVADTKWIRDTTVDAREIAVNLKSASNEIQKNTAYLNHSLRIPFGKDSLTTAFVGHSLDLSVYTKVYKDNITDATGRQFYNNVFLLHPTTSADSMRTLKFDNKFYLRLQPWKDNSILSKIDVGVGDKLLQYYAFDQYTYLGRKSNVLENTLYAYAGARGMYKQYFSWDALGQVNFLGRQAGDFYVEANLSGSFYPFRKQRKSPVTFGAHFSTDLAAPDYYENHIWANHFRWNNDFAKKSTTKISLSLDIPYWKLNAQVGYAMLGNTLYYGSDGIIHQSGNLVNIITAQLRKEFVIWKFHLDNKLLFQYSSDQDVMPAPLLSANLRWFIQFDVVKKVMQMQIGANALYTTSWYMPGYNPDLGVFYNQKKEKFGNCPYLDVFVNIQWKRACIFLKVENINKGWPVKDNRDYFTAAGHIHTQTVFKAGIFWPFYIQPSKHTHNVGADAHAGHDHGAGAGAGAGAGRMGASGSRIR